MSYISKEFLVVPWYKIENWSSLGGSGGYGSSTITAVAQVPAAARIWSLAWELLHAMDLIKKRQSPQLPGKLRINYG